MKLASCYKPDYRFSYLSTKDDAEIDLVVERPGLPLLFIEIKNTTEIREHHLRNLKALAKDMPDCEAICLSNDPYRKSFDLITAIPWYDAISDYFC